MRITKEPEERKQEILDTMKKPLLLILQELSVLHRGYVIDIFLQKKLFLIVQ